MSETVRIAGSLFLKLQEIAKAFENIGVALEQAEIEIVRHGPTTAAIVTSSGERHGADLGTKRLLPAAEIDRLAANGERLARLDGRDLAAIRIAAAIFAERGKGDLVRHKIYTEVRGATRAVSFPRLDQPDRLRGGGHLEMEPDAETLTVTGSHLAR